MRKKGFLFTTVFLMILMLTGCQTVDGLYHRSHEYFSGISTDKAGLNYYKPTCETNVMLVTKKELRLPYTKIGTVWVRTRNWVGTKRQTAEIQDIMRKYAAKMGGNAILDVTENHGRVTGTVILIKKDLNGSYIAPYE